MLCMILLIKRTTLQKHHMQKKTQQPGGKAFSDNTGHVLSNGTNVRRVFLALFQEILQNAGLSEAVIPVTGVPLGCVYLRM